MEAGLIDKSGKPIATVSVAGTDNYIDTVAAGLNNIALAPVPTVCRHAPKIKHDNTAYQTEAQMETSLIFQLELNGIRYEPSITNEEASSPTSVPVSRSSTTYHSPIANGSVS